MTDNVLPIKEEQIKKLACDIAKALIHSDHNLVQEIKNMTVYMEQAKSEINALRPKELKDDKIPDATNVLDVIIKTNEEACAKILSSAEALAEVAENTPTKLRERLLEISTDLFEASTFDDLNGQRTRKVIKTFKEIETRLGRLLSVLEVTDHTPVIEEPVNLMEGPQDPQKAASQDEIDKLLSGF